jgi:hypothetical protein
MPGATAEPVRRGALLWRSSERQNEQQALRATASSVTDTRQGFLYARPLDAEGIAEFLGANPVAPVLVEDHSV